MISGRADHTPLAPVIKRLKQVYVADLSSIAPASCSRAIEPHIVQYKPDLMLILGDRAEILGAALTATTLAMPIAHIHGGEASFGSYDNQIRDALTKLSHIHFVAAPEFKIRLVEGLGEDPKRVHVVGAPGLDNLINLPKREPEKYFVCTYHPATLGKTKIHKLLEVLDKFTDYHQIWTGVNDDPGSDQIRLALHGRDCRQLRSRDYHLLCRHAACVVGNSSSGIIEAPTLEVPTVNVGSRQEGRLKGPSVFNCDTIGSIEMAIKGALNYKGPFDNPYGEPGASAKIAAILAEIDLDGILVKRWST